jgi:hypothetical protein
MANLMRATGSNDPVNRDSINDLSSLSWKSVVRFVQLNNFRSLFFRGLGTGEEFAGADDLAVEGAGN